jgi:predicted SAM-dependent methyltransferase
MPFEDSYFDVVYTSHFLEHLNLQQARFLLKEVYRVLKKGGIVRIVVPDLENICREYITILEKVLEVEDEQNFREKYQWIVIELLG